MKRGIKAESERLSLAIRDELGLAAHDPLTPRLLADRLDVTLIGLEDIPGVTPRETRRLLVVDPQSWSAFTVSGPDLTLVVFNSAHLATRQSNDVMHELSHIIRDHPPDELVTLPGLGLPIRTFDQEQEEEADWLAGCLLLPRPALLRTSALGWTIREVSQHYGASMQLAQYRRRITGVDVQMARSQPKQILRVRATD